LHLSFLVVTIIEAEEIIKIALKILLILSFGFSVQFLFFFLVFAIGGFTPAFLKETLVKSSVYTTVNSKIESLTSEDPSEDMILPFIKEQFTSSYIQHKSETLIDDTFAWVDGKTASPPVLSFSEIKTSIQEQNPELLAQLTQAANEMQAQQQEESVDGEQVSADTMDLNKIIKSDFSIPIGKDLGFLKQAYSLFKLALPITAIYLVVLLGLIGLLSKPLKSKLRWVGATFFSSILFCCLPIVIALGLSNAPIQLDAKNAELSGIFSSISTIVIRAFAGKYLQIEVLGVMVFIAIGIICFVLSSMVKSSSPVKVAVPKKRKAS